MEVTDFAELKLLLKGGSKAALHGFNGSLTGDFEFETKGTHDYESYDRSLVMTYASKADKDGGSAA